MSEPTKKLTVLRPEAVPPDIVGRLEKLEDSFVAGLQSIRAIKAELQKRTDQTPALEKLLDAKTVADILGETEKWVYSRAKAGELPAIRLGKYWKFSPSALQKWLVEQQQTP